MDDRQSSNKWDWIYATREMAGVGWYEPDPVVSRELVDDAVAAGGRSVIDVGGGASWLADHLVELNLERTGVLDISEAALTLARHRLGERADRIEWIVADLAAQTDIGRFDIWHDRAAFHFLLEPESRKRYVDLATRTLPVGGVAIVATFAEDGPERCSGMPVQRYEPEDLALAWGPSFHLRGSRRHLHHTPAGVPQQFQYSILERVPSQPISSDDRSAGLPART
ncbi:MAG: class I SAM-dependent methyltransferase [Chloroflexi bacterium]|nr:class I SAM-dependent methyltransferase [Chloroflexota bacterium]